ncbi:MAG: T9SS type A sorting domain-containing protein, partial [Flammeovirgaceae bacterium]
VTIAGNTVTIVKAGRVAITASQAGNASFAPAPDVTQSFCIKPAKPTITVSGTNTETITLTSSASVGNKWYLNGTAIPSATNATLTVTAAGAGVYKVQVVIDDCASEFSLDTPLIVTGDLPRNANAIGVYPNPIEDKLELIGIKGELSNVQLVDLAGRQNTILFEKHGDNYQANVQHISSGMYVLQVQDGTMIHRVKVIKK